MSSKQYQICRGGGETGTFDQNGGGLKASALIYGVSDFDQGSVDGFGHAFIAGSGVLTFVDYSSSHDITNPDKVFTVSNANGAFSNIDDLAPLSGAGSQNPVPEPGSLLLLLSVAAGLGLKFRGRLS